MSDEEMIEVLADLEHEQWIAWSQQVAATEPLSAERLERWRACWCRYSELSEEMKEHDRKWARKVLARLRGEEAK